MKKDFSIVKFAKLTGLHIPTTRYYIEKSNNSNIKRNQEKGIKKLEEKVREKFLKLPNWLDKLSRQVKLNLFGNYSANVLKDIADSISLSYG